ncbi:E3 ubiquitin-protein ligase TRIM33 isoform X2 [Clinocottus analis]
MDPAAEIRQQGCSCGSASTRWCLDCDEALCDICLMAHRRVTVTRSHRILNQPNAGDVSTPPVKFCRLHPSEPLKLYCFTCNKLTCRDCQLAAHMNHRYQFVKEALAAVKKQLQQGVQPITVQRDTMRRNLLDMKTRLQDISESRSNLQSELHQSFSFITDHLMKRKEEFLKQAEEVSLLESERIKMKMKKTIQLWKNQLLMTNLIEKAQNSNDLSTLVTYAAQVNRQLKECPDLDVSPPLVMSNLKVVTDRTTLEAVLRFGMLEVKWIPFSVSQTTNRQPSTASSSSTPAAFLPTDRPQPQTRTTAHSPVTVGCSATTSNSPSSKLRLSPSPSNVCPSTSTCGTVPQNGNIGNEDSSGPVNHAKHLSKLETPSPVNLSLSSDPSPVLKPVEPSLAVNKPTAAQNQNKSSTALPHDIQTTSCFTLLSVTPPFPKLLTKISPENTWPRNQKSLMGDISPEALPGTTDGKKRKLNPDYGGPSGPAPRQPLKGVCFATTSSPPSSEQRLTPNIGHPSYSPKDQQQNPVVRAVADSACDRSLQPVAARRPEPAENEPTSTVSEEPAPAGEPELVPFVPSDTEPKNVPEVSVSKPCSVIGHPHYILSQWQPRVSLFRLPVTPPHPGRPNPRFVLVPGEAEDEIYLKEMREDTEPQAGEDDDIITELPSSPDSPMTLVTVSCSACRAPNGSIICSFCGRGFHRHCHEPPVGPAIQSEWICSLCQDLLDPSDPFSSDRPPRPPSPCLSLQDQRRCERLLLQMKVEGCEHLPQSQLSVMSERLSLRRSPTYKSAAEFMSDAWSLFPDAAQGDDVLNRLKENLQSGLASENMAPSSRITVEGKAAAAPLFSSSTSDGLKVTEGPQGPQESEVKPKDQQGPTTRGSNMKKARKRLKDLLDQMQPPRSKRTKTSNAEHNTPAGHSGN